MPESKATIELSGLNFDEVWENIIKRFEGGEWNNDLNIVLEIGIAVVISAGGISGIILAVIKFSSNIIADKLSKKYELKLNKELEK